MMEKSEQVRPGRFHPPTYKPMHLLKHRNTAIQATHRRTDHTPHTGRNITHLSEASLHAAATKASLDEDPTPLTPPSASMDFISAPSSDSTACLCAVCCGSRRKPRAQNVEGTVLAWLAHSIASPRFGRSSGLRPVLQGGMQGARVRQGACTLYEMCTVHCMGCKPCKPCRGASMQACVELDAGRLGRLGANC